MDEKVLGKKNGKKRSRSVTQKRIVGKNKRKVVSAGVDGKESVLKDEEIIRIGNDKSKGDVPTSETGQRSSWIEVEKGKVAKTQANSKGQNADDAETLTKIKRGADWEIAQAFLSSPARGSSRLRPRKEVPSFRMVELDENDSERIVGIRVKIYWSGSRRWFAGSIKSFDNERGLHKIYYDDGDNEELDLRQERFELEIKPSDGYRVKIESHSGKKVNGFEGEKVIAELLMEESIERVNVEQLRKNSEPKKNKALKKATKGRSSESQVKKDTKDKKTEGLFVEVDMDAIPEKVVRAVSDEVPDVAKSGHASFGEEHDESKTIAEIARKARKYSNLQANNTESRKPTSDSIDCEESGIAKKEESDGTSEVPLDLPPTQPENPIQRENPDILLGTREAKNRDSAGDIFKERENISEVEMITSSYDRLKLGIIGASGAETVDILQNKKGDSQSQENLVEGA